MASANSLSRFVVRPFTFYRWLIPPMFSLLGLSYALWENATVDHDPVWSFPALVRLGLLGILCPFLAFMALTWAERLRERQRSQLIALGAIEQALNQTLELSQVLNRAIGDVLQVMHLQSGAVRLIENGQLVLYASRGVSSPGVLSSERSISIGRCICRRSAEDGEIVAVEDLDALDRLPLDSCVLARFRAILCVPVWTRDRVIGVLHVASQEPRVFDSADRILLNTIGHQMGVAVEKARLYAQLEQLSRELEERVNDRTGELLAAKEELKRKADTLQQVLTAERRVEERTRAHIARDLHDGVQQLIIGALFETQAARDAIVKHPEIAERRLDSAQELLHRIESEMRSAIYSLRPVALDAHGLVPALRELAESFTRVSKIPCDLRVEGTPCRFNAEAEVAVFRIVQEAVNNIETHAHAGACSIRVEWRARDLQVRIMDDGCGFDVAQVTRDAHTHLGLLGMRERAASIGGSVDMHSRAGEGTCVMLTVPLIDPQGLVGSFKSG